MIAPHRSNRSKPPTQDRRRLSRYMRRWLVERFFAWIQWQRRILVRWEYHAHNFLGFVQLACLVILLLLVERIHLNAWIALFLVLVVRVGQIIGKQNAG